MKQYFLGVDVGGSKCHAVISDETGQILGCGAGGTGIGDDGFALFPERILRCSSVERTLLYKFRGSKAWPADLKMPQEDKR